jgi:two-component system NtrC family response regulator
MVAPDYRIRTINNSFYTVYEATEPLAAICYKIFRERDEPCPLREALQRTRLPDGDGLDLLSRFQELAAEIQAMKLGAYDYITKPFDLDRLEMVIEKAFQRVSLQR